MLIWSWMGSGSRRSSHLFCSVVFNGASLLQTALCVRAWFSVLWGEESTPVSMGLHTPHHHQHHNLTPLPLSPACLRYYHPAKLCSRPPPPLSAARSHSHSLPLSPLPLSVHCSSCFDFEVTAFSFPLFFFVSLWLWCTNILCIVPLMPGSLRLILPPLHSVGTVSLFPLKRRP